MSFPINPISLGGLSPAILRSPAGTSQPAAFQSALGSAIRRVEELHGPVLATQLAGPSLEGFLEVRNQVVQAYREVMRMQM